jgi:hypothetical protein
MTENELVAANTNIQKIDTAIFTGAQSQSLFCSDLCPLAPAFPLLDPPFPESPIENVHVVHE